MIISIGQAARLLGVSVDTLRNWEKIRKLIPERTTSGRRFYTKEQIDEIREDNELKETTLHSVKVKDLKKSMENLFKLNDNDVVQIRFFKNSNYNTAGISIFKEQIVNGEVITIMKSMWGIPWDHDDYCNKIQLESDS